MREKRYLEDLIGEKLFRFNHLSIDGIDNEALMKLWRDYFHLPDSSSKVDTILEQEICLFADIFQSGDQYCQFLHDRLVNSLQNKEPLPVVRFYDGEYAFYSSTLGCNGLYKQAESTSTIKRVLPRHIEAMKYLAEYGLFAPLVFPGNSNIITRGSFTFWRSQKDKSGADFLDFIHAAGINLHRENYVPFNVVYAYLTSKEFAAAVDGKNICILNSEYNEKSCHDWFALHSSRPRIDYVPIPAEYVATRWEEIKKEVFKNIPRNTDLCLTGAGVGALLICKDIAQAFSITAIDAGHILNMMNSRIDKSNGVRLYTLRRQ